MLLKYQEKFLNSEAKIKLWSKSRQIGATWTIAGNSCLVSGRSDNPYDTWFSSTNSDAGKMFIQDVGEWAVRFNKVAKLVDELLIEDEGGDIKATAVEFASGKSAYSLSSAPRNFRGKRGDVILDEFAFHDNQRELWKACTSVTRWGGNIYVLSSVGRENDFFEELCERAKKTKGWYYQQTMIIDAINDGILDAIWKKDGRRKKPTLRDKDAFLQGIRDEFVDEESFLQEYMCVPASAGGDYWLDWGLITGVEAKEVAIDGSAYKGGKTIIGNDIARRGDNSVFVVFELIGDVAHLVDMRILKNKTFAEQEVEMRELVSKYNPYRIYADQTGMGEKVVEDYKKLFGSMMVQGILFNLASKHDMAVNSKQIFEDKKIRLPFANEKIRNDLRKIKKETGAGNVPKFTAERDKEGHGDIAWAIFLALLGLKQKYQEYKYIPVGENIFKKGGII